MLVSIQLLSGLDLSFSSLLSLISVMSVSYAVGALGDSTERASVWAVAIETILTIATNILKQPGDAKYYQINVANPNFNRR